MKMEKTIADFNNEFTGEDYVICWQLFDIISEEMSDLESKIWHRQPVWFMDGNPIVGYSKEKKGIRLMFWSGIDFQENYLKPSTGKFKDASIFYNSAEEINTEDLKRWLEKSRIIQWDYKNIVKRKGKLEKIEL